MRLLLDTHIYLWWVKGASQLSQTNRELISNAVEVYVSSAVFWEIVIKIKLKKLDVNLHELMDALEKSGFLELPITMKHTAEVIRLPNLHRDPFDRIMIAQAMSEPLNFLTVDKQLHQYSELVKVI